MLALIRKHPVASYFALTFLISWGGVAALIFPGPIPAPEEVTQRLFIRVYLAMLAGPPIAGIAMTAIVGGAESLRDYRARLFTWRVAPRWYAIALFTAPFALVATLAGLAIAGAEWRPALFTTAGDTAGPVHAASRSALLLTAVLVGLGAGFFEELGWTGFCLPTLRRRASVFSAALALGMMWGLWHLLAVWWGSEATISTLRYWVFLAVALFSFLPPYRILMARVFDATNSTLLAILMHASLTSCMILMGTSARGAGAIVYDIAFAAVLWLLVHASSVDRSDRGQVDDAAAPLHIS